MPKPMQRAVDANAGAGKRKGRNRRRNRRKKQQAAPILAATGATTSRDAAETKAAGSKAAGGAVGSKAADGAAGQNASGASSAAVDTHHTGSTTSTTSHERITGSELSISALDPSLSTEPAGLLGTPGSLLGSSSGLSSILRSNAIASAATDVPALPTKEVQQDLVTESLIEVDSQRLQSSDSPLSAPSAASVPRWDDLATGVAAGRKATSLPTGSTTHFEQKKAVPPNPRPAPQSPVQQIHAWTQEPVYGGSTAYARRWMGWAASENVPIEGLACDPAVAQATKQYPPAAVAEISALQEKVARLEWELHGGGGSGGVKKKEGRDAASSGKGGGGNDKHGMHRGSCDQHGSAQPVADGSVDGEPAKQSLAGAASEGAFAATKSSALAPRAKTSVTIATDASRKLHDQMASLRRQLAARKRSIAECKPKV